MAALLAHATGGSFAPSDPFGIPSTSLWTEKWLPNVAQAAVREGMTDLVGIARMQLAYPRFISDVLDGRVLDSAAIEAAF